MNVHFAYNCETFFEQFKLIINVDLNSLHASMNFLNIMEKHKCMCTQADTGCDTASTDCMKQIKRLNRVGCKKYGADYEFFFTLPNIKDVKCRGKSFGRKFKKSFCLRLGANYRFFNKQ